MVLGLVGFRKLMDYTPKIFSQRDLFWLDNLMPSSNDKKEKTDENGLGNEESQPSLVKRNSGALNNLDTAIALDNTLNLYNKVF